MKAYLINLQSAVNRLQEASKSLKEAGFDVVRVEAINGSSIEPQKAHYNERAYRIAHGKRTNLREIGCYLSHLKALEEFIASGEPYALIAEDDAKAHPETLNVINKALAKQNKIQILRLSSVHRGTPIKLRTLSKGFKLTICLTRQTGAGAYVVSHKAAKRLVDKLSPMFLPYDHALDREWFYGLKAAFITPAPINQHTTNDTQISALKSYKLPPLIRYLSVFPFRIYNETLRFPCRLITFFKLKK